MSKDKLLEIFFNKIKFDITEYLVPEGIAELNDFQKKIIEDASFILKDNIVGDIKKLGGNYKKNEEKFKAYEKKAEEELILDKYKDIKKDLKDLLKDYLKNLRKIIEKTCVAIIPVKDMPWVDILFRTVPRLELGKKKVNLIENGIAYYGEIKCVISRTTIYGKMKNAEPLFAPFMGELNLGDYKLDESEQKGPKSQIYPYISAVINSLDNVVTRSQLAKYHEGYQRHGEPICDFLMKDQELMGVMAKISSGIDSKRLSSDVAVCGIAIPQSSDKTTLMIMTDEGKESERFMKCFESLLRFSAACCEAPSSRRDFAEQATQMTQAAQAQQGPTGPGVGGLVAPSGQTTPSTSPGVVRTPGGQELKVWTEEDLQKTAQERGGGALPPNMEVWDENELSKMASERGSGIPDGMEVWTEDDLEDMAKKRQGGIDIPEWKADDSLPECAKCGYTLRKGWSECPICGLKVGEKPAPEADKPATSEQPKIPDPQPATQPSKEESTPQKPKITMLNISAPKKEETKKDNQPPTE